MFMDDRTDAELLCAPDTRSFELFYRRHFETVLGFFARRTRDHELSADLTAETFAAALAGRRRYRPERGRADSWLFAIAYHKLADAQRRGAAEQRDAIRAHVLWGRSYADIARSQRTSEAVVRKRVSRGLAAVRERIGARP